MEGQSSVKSSTYEMLERLSNYSRPLYGGRNWTNDLLGQKKGGNHGLACVPISAHPCQSMPICANPYQSMPMHGHTLSMGGHLMAWVPSDQTAISHNALATHGHASVQYLLSPTVALPMCSHSCPCMVTRGH